MSLSVKTEVEVALGLDAEVDAHVPGRVLRQLGLGSHRLYGVVFVPALVCDEF